ncbi:hypothetical protein Pfo_005277 [Paulownia fortunei]|nr:hypothetical protein Pfo_005277 [Paulownia fortunei]
MAEEKFRLLDEGIAKAKVILDGYPANSVFSAEEYMKYYDCVYDMCLDSTCGYSWQLLDRFKTALEESISSKVLPSLLDKNGVPLLIELLHFWANYKVMVKCLRRFFLYLDRQIAERKTAAPLSDTSVCSFDELVCKVLHKRLTNATLFLITQDRNGVPVDWNLLQGISTFYVEVGALGKTPYYDMFEEAILADAANYYSQLASQWYLCYSSTNYVLKVEQCVTEEKGRVSQFLYQSSVEKLVQVVRSQMIGQYADKLAEKQKAENMDSIVDQDLVNRCSSLHIG